MMEDWELELEFLTWDAHEKAVRKQNGTDSSVEEYEVSDDDFKTDLKSFEEQEGVKFDPTEWEEVE